MINILSKTKKAILSYKDNNHIIIEECDLFKQKGLKVIQVHRTFDMNNSMVKRSTIWGQFITQCEQRGFDLNEAVDKEISLRKRPEMYDESKPFNKNVFPVGDVLRIIDNNQEEYAIAAFNDIKSNGDVVHMDMNMYIDFLDKLWESISNSGLDASIINVPVFGNKVININGQNIKLDTEVAIALIVLSYLKISRKKGIFKDLRICAHSDSSCKIRYKNWQDSLLPFFRIKSKHPLGIRELSSANNGLFAGVFPRAFKNKNQNKKDWKYDVFISKNQKDYEHASFLKKWLEDCGYNVFESEYDLRENGNSEYWKEINKCLDSSRCLVLLLSKNEKGNNSKVDREWQRFLEDYDKGRRTGNIKLLGILVDDTPIESILPEISAFECLYLASDQERILNFIN